MIDAIAKRLSHVDLMTSHPLLWTFAISVILIVMIAILSNLLLTLLIEQIDQRSDQKKLKQLFYHSLLKPIRLAIWIIALWLICRLPVALVDLKWLNWLSYLEDKLVQLGLLLTIFWASLAYTKQLRHYFIQKYTASDSEYHDCSLIEAIYVASRIGIFLVAIFAILGSFHISVLALSGIIGILGIALTISQKELIQNLIGGLVIYLDRPFSVGDSIRNESGSIEGTVETIGFRLTKIIILGCQPLYVPNATFLDTAVTNRSRMKNRRILQHMGVRYDDIWRLPAILEAITTMLKTHPDIDTKNTILVCMLNGNIDQGAYGPYSLNFMVYAFTKTIGWAAFQTIQDDILFQIHHIIRDHGAEMAFPTQTLDIPTPIAIDTARAQHLFNPNKTPPPH